MANQRKVCWLHHSKVYHRRASVYTAWCGAKIGNRYVRVNEGTERSAEKSGRRPCKRCFYREARVIAQNRVSAAA
jgi:methylphosphotriester-DNA--protein-cysteine methyltransferase